MVDFKSRQDEEIEKLTRTLRNSKLANSESEARRMAEEMMGISKKVADDFREREKNMYGEQKKSAEHDLAHKQMEMLAANLASGKSNARLDLSDLSELQIDKPLKDLVAEEEEPHNNEEDDAVEVSPPAEESAAPEPAAEEPAEEKSSWDKPVEEKKEGEKEVEEVDAGEDADVDDDPNDESEEEKSEDSSEEAPAKEAADVEAAEEDDSEGVDFSIKELDSAPAKSDDDRQREIKSMDESKIDLSSMFNANK